MIGPGQKQGEKLAGLEFQLCGRVAPTGCVDQLNHYRHMQKWPHPCTILTVGFPFS